MFGIDSLRLVGWFSGRFWRSFRFKLASWAELLGLPEQEHLDVTWLCLEQDDTGCVGLRLEKDASIKRLFRWFSMSI